MGKPVSLGISVVLFFVVIGEAVVDFVSAEGDGWVNDVST